MAEENSDSEKTEDPSQYRIDEFRNKGQVSQSKELTSLLILAATMITLSMSMVFIFEVLFEYMDWLFKLNPTLVYSEEAFKKFVEKSILTGLKCAAPALLTSLCIGVISTIMQVGILFSPDILNIKLERLNPLEGIKRIFAKRAIVETFKGILKFSIILSIAYFTFKNDSKNLGGFFQVEILEGVMYGKGIVLRLAFSILLGLVVVAIFDFAWEKYSYKQKLMLTKQQAKDELKEKEGNPEIKQRIRTIQREMAQKRMLNDIKGADFVVTNPTHISVAIKYDLDNMVAPKVVGKGADFMAKKIRELAKENDVPLIENVSLARTLYKTVKIGESVPRNLYKAIAEILAFVYKLKKKNKALDVDR